MNGFIVILLVALAIGVAVGFGVQLDPGYVRISWLNWLIETNIWIAFLLFLAFYFLFHFGFRALVRTLAIRAGYTRWVSGVQRQRSHRRTQRGLMELAEGRWQRAQRHLVAGARLSDIPLSNFLAAAEAAHAQGQADEADQLLEKARHSTPGSDLAVDLIRARMRLDRGACEEAQGLLLALRKDHPQQARVLALLAQTCRQLKDWNRLQSLLPELQTHGALAAAEWSALEREVWQNLLTSAADEALRRPDPGNPTGRLNDLWDRLPATLRKDESLVSEFADALCRLGAVGHAEKILEKSLAHHWHERWVIAFGQLPTEAAKHQLEMARGWLRTHPDDPALLLTLGRLALRNSLWQQAREFFEASYALQRRADTAAELGRLLAALGHLEASNAYYAQCVGDAIQLPALPQPSPLI